MENFELTVPEEYHLERIDRVIIACLEADMSRSYLQRLIKNSNVLVNDETIKANYKAKEGDVVRITIPEPEVLELTPQDIPLNILYQDQDILVINKQPGLVVHPGPGNWDNTLVNALLYHIKDLSSIGGTVRPGIVHRLDKDTTGIMIIAKNDIAHKGLVDQFAERTVTKHYAAITTGKPKQNTFRIDEPIARHRVYRHKMTVDPSGKVAVSDFTLQKFWNIQGEVFSHFKIHILTGRTHQIRVHCSSIGMPIIGDQIYSKKWQKYKVTYLLLASTYLAFKHPVTKKDLEFTIDMPQHMADFIEKLEKRHALFSQ